MTARPTSEPDPLRTIVLTGGRTGDLKEAAACLERGGLVAFPTETVYGLGANALDPDAVERVFRVKGRPPDNPLIVHVPGMGSAEGFAESIPEKARELAGHIWPGPLTIVVERNDIVPDAVTAGLDTVAIRVPRHPLTIRLLELFGGGIVGPSANLSGRPSPTTARDVLEDLDGRIEMIVDGGPAALGLESTVIDFTLEDPVILRQGALTREEVERIIGPLGRSSEALAHRSPGTRHRHYAPKARVVIVPRGNTASIESAVEEARSDEGATALLTHTATGGAMHPEGVRHVALTSVMELARELYQRFREFDRSGCRTVIVEGTDEQGIGAAVMDRLRRATERTSR